MVHTLGIVGNPQKQLRALEIVSRFGAGGRTKVCVATFPGLHAED